MTTSDDQKACFEGKQIGNGKAIFISAPAKINLFLKVKNRRPDGYHNIYSWFQAIDLADHLEIEATNDGKIEIETDNPQVPTGPENLIYRTAQLIQNKLNRKFGFNVKLRKRIPVGAGLGGGSSDAAAFIRGTNILLDLKLGKAEMAELGLEVGSDVPFFFSRGQAEVTGRGEIVKEISLPLDYCIGLLTPRFEIRAATAYGMVKLDLTEPCEDINLLRCQRFDDLVGVISRMTNDLERNLCESYPILCTVRETLIRTGADLVRLTGSGPTWFALYRDKTLVAEKWIRSVKGGGWDAAMASPVALPALR